MVKLPTTTTSALHSSSQSCSTLHLTHISHGAWPSWLLFYQSGACHYLIEPLSKAHFHLSPLDAMAELRAGNGLGLTMEATSHCHPTPSRNTHTHQRTELCGNGKSSPRVNATFRLFVLPLLRSAPILSEQPPSLVTPLVMGMTQCYQTVCLSALSGTPFWGLH